jgi:hypothetical protein
LAFLAAWFVPVASAQTGGLSVAVIVEESWPDEFLLVPGQPAEARFRVVAEVSAGSVCGSTLHLEIDESHAPPYAVTTFLPREQTVLFSGTAGTPVASGPTRIEFKPVDLRIGLEDEPLAYSNGLYGLVLTVHGNPDDATCALGAARLESQFGIKNGYVPRVAVLPHEEHVRVGADGRGNLSFDVANLGNGPTKVTFRAPDPATIIVGSNGLYDRRLDTRLQGETAQWRTLVTMAVHVDPGTDELVLRSTSTYDGAADDAPVHDQLTTLKVIWTAPPASAAESPSSTPFADIGPMVLALVVIVLVRRKAVRR